MNMKRNLLFKTALLLWLCTLLALSGCVTRSGVVTQEHEPATLDLINILRENPELERLLIRSIEAAREINPDTNTNPAQSLHEYFAYLNWAVKAMPWNALPSAVQIPSLFDAVDVHEHVLMGQEYGRFRR